MHEMLEKVSSKELTEWMLFYEIEPWGTYTDMYGPSMVASTLLNVHRDKKKRREPIKPSDIMPRWDDGDDIEDSVMQVRQLNAMFGGVEKQNGDNR